MAGRWEHYKLRLHLQWIGSKRNKKDFAQRYCEILRRERFHLTAVMFSRDGLHKELGLVLSRPYFGLVFMITHLLLVLCPGWLKYGHVV